MQLLKSRIFLASAASLLLLSGCDANQDAKPATPVVTAEIAVTVNGTPISKSSVDMLVQQGNDRKQADTPETRVAVINQMVLQTLISDEAIKKGLDKTPAVEDQLRIVKLSVLSNAYIQDYLDNQKPSDEEVKAEYDRLKAAMVGDEYKARHILVANEAEAQAIIVELQKDPEAFAKLAQEQSIDTGSKGNGGDIGWFDLTSMVPEFGAAAAKLQKGQFTQKPVKTEFGYHVIMLDDSRAIQAPPFEEVKAQLVESVQQQKLKTLIEDLKSKAKIEMTDAPAPTAAESAEPAK